MTSANGTSRSEENLRDLKDAGPDWATTEEGRKAVEDAIRRGARMAERMRESMKVDRKMLNEPFTI